MILPLPARLFAALIALIGLTGLGVQLVTSTIFLGSFGAALWSMARYYTNIGNLGVALIFAGVALDRRAAMRPLMIGGAAINAALIGIVYALLLSGHIHPGESVLSVVLLHYVVPVLSILFWLICAPRGGHDLHEPLVWGAPPLLYFIYVLARAHFDGRYPYPFINVAQIGWLGTLVNAAVITFCFMLFGMMLISIDRLLARRGR